MVCMMSRWTKPLIFIAVSLLLGFFAGASLKEIFFSRGGSPEPTPVVTPLADDKVVLDSPLPGALVTSPLTVRGKARGTWFFEASFPVVLTDWDGRIITTGIAQAKADWMTTEFVPFEAVLTFVTPAGGPGIPDTGSLILKKDNPSGLPEHDDAREITVRFR